MSRKATRRAERATSLRRRILAGATTVIVGLGLAVGGLTPVAATPGGSGGGGDNTNSASYWKTEYPNSKACYKYDPPSTSNTHGYLSGGGVVLNTFDQSWPGDRWEVLIVKGGADQNGGGDAVYPLPAAGQVYSAPTNPKNDTPFGVSHWIVCKGEAPDEPRMVVDCVEIVYDFGRGQALSGEDHINVDIVLNGVKGQINVEVNESQSQNPDGGSGYYLLFKFPVTSVSPNTFVPDIEIGLTQEEFDSGIVTFPYSEYLTGEWQIQRIQFNNLYFNDSNDPDNYIDCTDQTTEPAINITAASVPMACDSPTGSFTVDVAAASVAHAGKVVWSSSLEPAPTLPGTVSVDEPSVITVTARIADDYVGDFALNDESGLGVVDATTGAITFTFTFTAPTDCAPPPCIPDEFISYTYISSGTSANTGVVTVEQPSGYDDQLCAPLYVTAAAWAFDIVDDIWTQTLVVANEINGGNAITEVGSYEFGAPVGCGQGDIYASRTDFPQPSPFLNGPNNPAWPDGVDEWDFTEDFLHDMGFSGPNPTYMVTSPGCNAVEPVAPAVTVIDECGTYGSLTLTTSPYLAYVVKNESGDTVTTVEFDSTAGVEQITVPGATTGSFTVIPVASFPYILKNYDANDAKWSPDLGTYVECELEPIPTRAVCEGTTSASFTLPAITGVTWFVNGEERAASNYPVYFTGEYVITFDIDSAADGGPYELKPGAQESFTFTYAESDLCEPPTSPLTNAAIAFTDPTCLEPQGLDVDSFFFDAKLATLEEVSVDETDRTYTVVFTAIGDDTVFDKSDDVAAEGREVSTDGKTLTFEGTLAGPNTALCEEIPVIDPFDYVDTCLTASYTLISAEGLSYLVTVNDDDPFEVTFGENETSKTFSAEPGDYVLATPVAEPGYVLHPDQPAPLERTFNTYPDGCQLPELANWPANATATNEVCTPFGVTSGSITVLLSTGPVGNPTPVRYYLAYETADQQELTNATTTVPAGSYVVTAVLTDDEDSINDSGSGPVTFPLTVGAADESDCDLPTLAITGASNAVTGVGIGAVIIILAGLGFVLRRQLVA